MRVSSGSNILHGYVHNDYIVNNNLTIFRCINNEGLIVIKPYVSRFVTLLKDRQGYVRPEWRHFLIAPVVFFAITPSAPTIFLFPFQDYFQPSFCLVVPCIEDLHNISCKDERVVSVCGLSEINGSEPSLSVLIFSSRTHWQRKRAAFNGPQASSHISSMKPQYVACTLPFLS